MNKKIISEINRFKEILGLPIINEGKIPNELFELLAKAFYMDVDDFISSIGKGSIEPIDNIFDELSKLKNIEVNTLIDDFKFGDMTEDTEDLFVALMLKSNNESIVNAAIKSYSDSTKGPLVDIIENIFKTLPEDQIKKLPKENFTNYKNRINELIDETPLTNNTKEYLKKEFSNKFSKIRTSSVEIPSPPKIEDAYDLASIRAKELGKKIPNLSYFKGLEDELIKENVTKEKLIDAILTKATDKPGLLDFLQKTRVVGREVGGATGELATGVTNTSKKILIGWSFGALLLLAAVAFAFDFMSMRSTILYGTKSSIFSKMYKENFYNLPKEIQDAIVTHYDEDRVTNDKKIEQGIQSFAYDENDPDTFTVNLMGGGKETWKKVQTGGNKYWSKEPMKKTKEESETEEKPEDVIERFKQYLIDENDWTEQDLAQISDIKYENGKISYVENWGENKTKTVDFK